MVTDRGRSRIADRLFSWEIVTDSGLSDAIRPPTEPSTAARLCAERSIAETFRQTISRRCQKFAGTTIGRRRLVVDLGTDETALMRQLRHRQVGTRANVFEAPTFLDRASQGGQKPSVRPELRSPAFSSLKLRDATANCTMAAAEELRTLPQLIASKARALAP
jgi:hypothetical protein